MRTLLLWLVGSVLLLSAVPAPARADIYVVVNAASGLQTLSRKDVTDLYMGRTHVLADGTYAAAYDLPSGSALRAEFYEQLIGLTQAQVNSYWARLIFTGETPPPRLKQDESSVLEAVKSQTGGIGYTSHEPGDKALRVVLVLKSGV